MKPNSVFYLRGFPRSGTNWLCNLLNLHPEIHCHGEFHIERLFEGVQSTLDLPFGLLSRRSDEFKKAFYNFIEELICDWCGNAPVCGDRTPIAILDAFIPNRKYLLITRDVRDVLVSWMYHHLRIGEMLSDHPLILEKQQLFVNNPDYFEENKNKLLDIEFFTRLWAKQWNDQIIRDMGCYNDALKGDLDIECFWVKYEDLISNTDEVRSQAYTFLGLNPFKANQLSEQTIPGFKKTDTNSHYRKGKTGAWKEYFTNKQLSWVQEEAEEGMKLLNLDF